MLETITSLIEKLEGAEVGSNRLSDEVLSACGYAETRFPMDSCTYWVHPSAPKSPLSVAQESVTTSLDAALALAERFWPGQEYEITTLYGVARVTLNMNHGDQAGPHYGHNDCGHVPSAICAAILRAQSEARV
jgi:hypothetical protein